MSSSNPEADNEIGLPDSAVGRRLGALREASQAQDFSEKDRDEHYTGPMLNRLPPVPMTKMMLAAPIFEVEAISDLELFVTINVSGIGTIVMLCEVEGSAPHRITKLTGARKQEGGGKGTSIMTAVMRAMHSSLDSPIFVDSLAERFIGESGRTMLEMMKSAPRSSQLAPVRYRWAEDRLLESIDQGVSQYLILGAGFETFAFRRSDLLPKLRVFEVDLGETQAWKREVLEKESIDIPEGLSLVPVDFESDDFIERLEDEGFVRSEPAFVSWMNVAWYLTAPTVETTLRRLTSLAPKTEVVFNYMLPESSWDEEERTMRSAKLMEKIGEPILSFFTPQEMEALLRKLGFEVREHLEQRELHEIYLPDRAGEFRVDTTTRLVRAVV